MHYTAYDRLSLELRASAFAIPHHAELVDSAGTEPVQYWWAEKSLASKLQRRWRGALVGLRWTVRE